METQITEYINIEKKALDLGCNIPIGIAILPRNFDTANSVDELIYESTAPTIRSLLRQAGISETKIEKEGTKIPQGSKKSWEWIGPIIFISQIMLINGGIPLMLNMISSYLYDTLKGHHHDAEVTLEFVVEKAKHTKKEDVKEYKRVTVKGSPKEIKSFDLEKIKELISD